MEVPIKLNNDTIAEEKDGTRQGLGWVLQTYQGHRIVWHSGDHVTGFTANFSRFTNDKLAVIVLTNLMPFRPAPPSRSPRRGSPSCQLQDLTAFHYSS